MADIDLKLALDVEVTIKLNGTEASALGALAGYGTDEFLRCFYKNMGAAYLRPHEKGLRSLFAKVRGTDSRTQATLGEVRKAIAAFHQQEREARARRNSP